MPESHVRGSTGSTFLTRLFNFKDDRLKLNKKSIQGLEKPAFSKAVREFQVTAQVRSHLVIVHGYNVTFEAAALRAAQLGFDLRIPGITAFFSWPSQGSIAGYSADEVSAEASGAYLREFLADFLQQAGPDSVVHLLADTMGCRAVLSALDGFAGEFARFGQLILLGPDVDSELMRLRAPALVRLCQRTTMYVFSSADLRVASFLYGYPRAGYFPPIAVIPEIDTILVKNANVLSTGFDKRGLPVLRDIHTLLLHDTPPSGRMMLVPTTAGEEGQYWILDAR